MTTNNVLRSPFSGEVVWNAPWMTQDEAIEAVKMAESASAIWKHVPLGERITRIRQAIKLFEAGREELAYKITATTGWLCEEEYQGRFCIILRQVLGGISKTPSVYPVTFGDCDLGSITVDGAIIGTIQCAPVKIRYWTP